MQHPKPDKPIAQRVAEFFQCQIAWYGRVLDHTAALEPRLDHEDFDALEAERALYTQDIAEQDAQLKALLREWQSSPKPPREELERIRQLVRRAEELAKTVAGELELASQRTGARAQEVRQTLQNLRQGRQIFRRYRQGTGSDAGFDEKA